MELLREVNVELLIIVLLLILIGLMAVMIFRQPAKSGEREMEYMIKNALLEFRSQIQDSVNTTRQEMSKAREDINRRTRETLGLMAEMRSTVEKIINRQEEVNKLGQSLKDILQAPKIRGNYAEAILGELLERVLPKGIWARQYKLGEGAVVDAAIKYRDIIIPIDAKFPRDNYIRYLNCEEPKTKEELWRQFERDVILRIREISKYVDPATGTCDFALMFIPSEAVYYEIVAERNHPGSSFRVMEEAEKHKVWPVSPNTFYAFLQIIMSGIRNLEVLSHARRIQEKLVKLETKFAHFYKQYETVGKELDKAVAAFNKGDRHIGLFKRELEEIVQITGPEDNKPPA